MLFSRCSIPWTVDVDRIDCESSIVPSHFLGEYVGPARGGECSMSDESGQYRKTACWENYGIDRRAARISEIDFTSEPFFF